MSSVCEFYDAQRQTMSPLTFDLLVLFGEPRPRFMTSLLFRFSHLKKDGALRHGGQRGFSCKEFDVGKKQWTHVVYGSHAFSGYNPIFRPNEQIGGQPFEKGGNPSYEPKA